MEAKKLLLAVAVLTAVPLCASFASGTRASPDSLKLTPQQFVDGRRAAMRLSAADIQLIRTAGEKGADIRRMAPAAQAIAEWAAVLPAFFPAGTDSDAVRTTARPEIWSNRADFEQRAQDLATAAASLAESLAAGDTNASRERWDATWQSCNACHERYRRQAPPSN